MNAMPKIIVLNDHCTGRRGNANCKSAHKLGRSVHMITEYDSQGEALIMPSYHFETIAAGKIALESAWETAVTITTDDELYAARAAGVAHKLPVGWIDPSRR